MNGNSGDLRKVFLHAVFQRGGDVMDLRDGQAAVHGAVTRGQNLVFHPADVHFVAIHQFVVFTWQGVDVILDRAAETCHFAVLAIHSRDVSAERFDVDIHDRSGAGRGSGDISQRADFFLEFRSPAVRIPQAQLLGHFQVHLDEQPPIELVRGKLMDGQAAPRGNRANPIKQVLPRGSARLHVNHHVGGNDFSNAMLDGIGNGVHLFEAG